MNGLLHLASISHETQSFLHLPEAGGMRSVGGSKIAVVGAIATIEPGARRVADLGRSVGSDDEAAEELARACDAALAAAARLDALDQQLGELERDSATPEARAYQERLAFENEARAFLRDAPKLDDKTRMRRAQALSRATTVSPIARQLVRPGDSMPNRLTKPGSPCWAGPSMRKSAAGSPGPLIFGRMPA